MIKVSKKYEPVVRKWQQELRSGNYDQTTDELVREELDGIAFCCLGVYCEMRDKKCFAGYSDVTSFFEENAEQFDEEDSLFSEFLTTKLEKPFLDYQAEDLESAFVRLNDTLGFSFNQIADWIDTNITFEL